MSSASSEPLTLLNRASRSGTVSFFFSSPDTSMTIQMCIRDRNMDVLYIKTNCKNDVIG